MITVTSRISDEDINKLNQIAKRDDLYISQLIRRAIKKFLEEYNETN